MTSSWTSVDVEPVMFVVEILGARSSNAVDVRTSREDTAGPDYTTNTVATVGSDELLIAIHQSSSRSTQSVTFATGETVAEAQFASGSWTGAIGSRKAPTPGPLFVSTTQTSGTSAVVSMVTFFGP